MPGETIGGRSKHVLTQASDPAYASYVENVIWMESQVVFATLNVPGSNDDGAATSPWTGAWAGDPAQAAEQAAHDRANRAWLEQAFATSDEQRALGVVLLPQADMWDGTHAQLDAYDQLVQAIGDAANAFGTPVLMGRRLARLQDRQPVRRLGRLPGRPPRVQADRAEPHPHRRRGQHDFAEPLRVPPPHRRPPGGAALQLGAGGLRRPTRRRRRAGAGPGARRHRQAPATAYRRWPADENEIASPDWPFGPMLRVARPWASRPSGSAVGGSVPTEPFGTRRPRAYLGHPAGSS